MQQPFDKFLMFRNRLAKQRRHLGKQARRQGLGCFRIYDHDIPEFPFIIEFYEERVYVSEYKRRHALSEDAHDQWLLECKKLIAEVLEVEMDSIYFKLRQRKEGRQGQYQKLESNRNEKVVDENGLKFIVNLSDYLDTGLFLDHRLTRQMVKEEAAGKNMLNLFCYTGSFSLYALAGGANQVVSVDLSKTYLDWTERNVQLNFPNADNHQTVHADVKQFLKAKHEMLYDLVVMDPPTFSNSKRMDDILDIQRDHVELVNDCLELMSEGGVLYFSTNYTRFILDEHQLKAAAIKDITKKTTPFDFEGKLKRQCWRLVK